jgi:NADP-dependent 3-hydroxy acid dehydrogenase YdfG
VVTLPLAGTRAVVTGASRGIGEAVARALAGAGASVALVARSREALNRVASSLGGLGTAVPCDLLDASEVDRAIESVVTALGGPPRILVNNAGVFPFAPLHVLTADAFAAAMTVNVVAPFRFVRAFLGSMIEAKAGHVVTIGSVADRVAFPENGAYAASKFGARALHEVLRGETRGTGVRSTLVSPGPVDTAMWNEVDRDARTDLPARSQMLGPQDVAGAVLFALTQPASVNVDELRLSRT